MHRSATSTPSINQKFTFQKTPNPPSTNNTKTSPNQEFILLSDIFGLSLLVDSIDHPKPPPSTEGTVLGPFHSHEAQPAPNGSLISHDPAGEPCLVLCTLSNTAGTPLAGVKIDIWETDSHGFYDVQYPGRDGPDQRAVMQSDEQGVFWFKAIVPVPYPIPHDGPVGQLLMKLRRHWFRPAHVHFMFEKEGYDHLITYVLAPPPLLFSPSAPSLCPYTSSLSHTHTRPLTPTKTNPFPLPSKRALYLRNDPYETSDAVFGVKESLLIDLGTVSAEQAQRYGVPEGSKLISYDFVLVGKAESDGLREANARAAMEKLGLGKMRMWRGLPVPDVD